VAEARVRGEERRRATVAAHLRRNDAEAGADAEVEADFEVEVEAAEEVDTGTARSRRMEARAATARAAEEATLDCIKVWRPRESGLV